VSRPDKASKEEQAAQAKVCSRPASQVTLATQWAAVCNWRRQAMAFCGQTLSSPCKETRERVCYAVAMSAVFVCACILQAVKVRQAEAERAAKEAEREAKEAAKAAERERVKAEKDAEKDRIKTEKDAEVRVTTWTGPTAPTQQQSTCSTAVPASLPCCNNSILVGLPLLL
jgi:hypothetical protein